MKFMPFFLLGFFFFSSCANKKTKPQNKKKTYAEIAQSLLDNIGNCDSLAEKVKEGGFRHDSYTLRNMCHALKTLAQNKQVFNTEGKSEGEEIRMSEIPAKIGVNAFEYLKGRSTALEEDKHMNYQGVIGRHTERLTPEDTDAILQVIKAFSSK